MMRRLLVGLALTALAGCIPLGLWIYEDPRVEVTSVALDPADATYPVRLDLSLSNVNDFDVQMLRVELNVRVNGSPVVDRVVESAAVFPARDKQIVQIGVSPADLAPGARPASFGTDGRRYSVDGYMILKTPIGERRIPFTRTG
jgi:hypothetical protein